MTVTTRFAPSPTGFLHIGGARTALFNYLFAKHNNGRFLLRIEDTDRERSTQAAIDAILDGMNWLGLKADEPPVFQSERADRHREIAEAMLAKGSAFKCFVTPEELSAHRDEGQALRAKIKEGGLDGAALDEAKAKVNALLSPFRSPYRDGEQTPPAADAPYTVRLRAPDEGDITIEDHVQGEVKIAASEIDDLILLRADGTPTYMLAVVVDDHDMDVSHVIRGDDHLTNAFRQLPIYQAMGWTAPEFAHIPLIYGQDGKKLSKRHGALGVGEYREMGYLPEGVKNYLMRLGWAHGDDEIITEAQAIDWFGLEGITKAPSRMDFDKFGFINGEHMKLASPDKLMELLDHELSKEHSLDDEKRGRITLGLHDLAARATIIPDLAKAAEFLVIDRPLEISGKARKKLKGDALSRLADVGKSLEELKNWTPDALSEHISNFCEINDLSLGQVGPPLRTALTGGRPSPDLNLILYWLGKEETLGRINDILAAANITDTEEGTN